MKNYLYMLLCVVFLPLQSADNEIYVDQSGTGANIDLEQLGISNIIGGLNSTAGNLTAFDLDGATMTLDINMIGNTNKFLGDINATTFTGLYNFTGDTNTFTIQVDPTNTYSSAGSDQNIAVTGSSNTFTLNQGTTAIAANLNLDWIIQGSSNTVTSNINIDGATNYMDIDGSDNKFLGDINATTFTGLYNFTGDTNTFTIQVDPTNTYSSAGSDQNIAVTGSSNTFTLNQGTTAIAANLNLDWIIQGSSNTVTSNINIDGATNYMDIDGSDNTVNYTGTGVNASAGGYFWLDHTGGQRTFNIQQLSTQDNDWLKIISIGGNASSTVCVIQNDQGTSTSC